MDNRILDQITLHEDKVYYESRNFINRVLPFSLHIDIMVNTPHHYVHKQRELELIVGISGEGQVITDLKPIPAAKDEIVVIHPNHIHYVVSDTIFKYYCLIIDPDFLTTCGVQAESIYFNDHICDPELVRLFHKLYEEWNLDDPYRNAILKSYVSQILVTLCRHHQVSDITSKKESRTLRKIKQSISYIKINFRQSLSLDEIAEEAGLSKYHYCREFKKATDLTPIEFINRTRCEFAKNLFETKKYSVSEVSELSGFSTLAHFSKTFRSFFGAYPSEFVKHMNKETTPEVTPYEDLP